MDPISLSAMAFAAGTGPLVTSGAAAAAAGGGAASGLATAGIGATLAGGFMSAIGDIFGGKAQQSMYNYQAGVALQRAKVAEQNANFAIVSGETQAYKAGTQTGQAVGAQKAGQGAGNINVAGGSAAAVRASQTKAGQITEADIRTDAARRAYGQQVAAAEDVAQAGAYTAAGKTSRTASEFGAGASILGAIGSVGSKWQQASMAGVPGYFPQNTTSSDNLGA